MELLNDFNTTVKKAFEEIDPNWKNYRGLVICGTHSPQNIEEMIEKIFDARMTNRPFLGICFGHQIAAIEYALNVLKQDGATSQEFYNPNKITLINNREIIPQFIVRKREQGLKVGLHQGESWWNNYEVVEGFESMWKKPKNFITVQYHPEYQSSKDKPHPILKKFLAICKHQK